MIEGELPREVESLELGKAFVTWYLDESIGELFESRMIPEWLVEGRAHFALLPWEEDLVAYNARPCLFNTPRMARVALKELSRHLANAENAERVFFSFDGEVLKVRCGINLVAVPAKGAAWTNKYAIEAHALRLLPKRLMRDPIEVSLWEFGLIISGCRYSPILIDSVDDSQ